MDTKPKSYMTDAERAELRASGLSENGILLAEPDADNAGSAAGKLVFHVFAALAEFERGLIRERTPAGLAAARARGRAGGRCARSRHCCATLTFRWLMWPVVMACPAPPFTNTSAS
ncbi:hypothetical protein R75465_07408 [Paraburkholderia aspalathi]|nr:hypothetical protein R75465_07408 [Paraburkholderia aspalathi]